jgi:hypothetical protein
MDVLDASGSPFFIFGPSIQKVLDSFAIAFFTYGFQIGARRSTKSKNGL